jgi:hypothetical protein
LIGAGDDLHTGAGFFDTLDNDFFTRLKRSRDDKKLALRRAQLHRLRLDRVVWLKI